MTTGTKDVRFFISQIVSFSVGSTKNRLLIVTKNIFLVVTVSNRSRHKIIMCHRQKHLEQCLTDQSHETRTVARTNLKKN
jgi:hypothetical protein